MRKPFNRAGLHLRLFQGYRVQSFLIFNFRYQGDAPFGSTHQENLLSQFNQVQGTVTRQVASAQQVYKIVLWNDSSSGRPVAASEVVFSALSCASELRIGARRSTSRNSRGLLRPQNGV